MAKYSDLPEDFLFVVFGLICIAGILNAILW